MAHALALFAFGLVREPRLWAATGAGRAERPLWRAATSRAPRAAPRCSDDALEQFRRQLQRQMSDDGTAFNPLGAPGRFDLWATPHERVETGVVLFADFRAWQEGASTAAAAPFDQFALRGPLPRDLPADMIARVLPVIIVVSQGANGAHEALLLERRTGVMLGDMKGDEYACAPINTLWFGGTASRESVSVLAQSDGPAAPEGLSAVFSGVSVGPWAKARPLIEAGKITGSRSFVFAGKTVFKPGELERQFAAGYWKAARLSRDVLFKERSEPSSRKGSKPLWREALELCEGEHAELVQALYRENE